MMKFKSFKEMANAFYAPDPSEIKSYKDLPDGDEKQKYAAVEEKVNNGEWQRAGGECTCLVCKKEYIRHGNLSYEFYWLTELCDGFLVKL